MLTNVLALPLTHLVIETGNNQDWWDAVRYITANDEPVDLRGIEFDMQIRRRSDDHDVVIYASADGNRWVSIGDLPNSNHLVIHVPLEKMQRMLAGQYVGDVLAHDEHVHRVCFTLELTVIQGVTRGTTQTIYVT